MRKAIFSTGGSTLERFSFKTEVKKATIVKKRTSREKNAHWCEIHTLNYLIGASNIPLSVR